MVESLRDEARNHSALQVLVDELGLKPGERVVCEGVRNIRDGMKIEPRTISMDSLLRN